MVAIAGLLPTKSKNKVTHHKGTVMCSFGVSLFIAQGRCRANIGVVGAFGRHGAYGTSLWFKSPNQPKGNDVRNPCGEQEIIMITTTWMLILPLFMVVVPSWFNTLNSNDAYLRHWTVWSFIQIMASRAKLSTEPKLIYCWIKRHRNVHDKMKIENKMYPKMSSAKRSVCWSNISVDINFHILSRLECYRDN